MELDETLPDINQSKKLMPSHTRFLWDELVNLIRSNDIKEVIAKTSEEKQRKSIGRMSGRKIPILATYQMKSIWMTIIPK